MQPMAASHVQSKTAGMAKLSTLPALHAPPTKQTLARQAMSRQEACLKEGLWLVQHAAQALRHPPLLRADGDMVTAAWCCLARRPSWTHFGAQL